MRRRRRRQATRCILTSSMVFTSRAFRVLGTQVKFTICATAGCATPAPGSSDDDSLFGRNGSGSGPGTDRTRATRYNPKKCTRTGSMDWTRALLDATSSLHTTRHCLARGAPPAARRSVQLGVCLRTPRGLPSRPPGRRGVDGNVAVRPPRAPWRLMCAGELMGWGGGAKGRPPHQRQVWWVPPPPCALLGPPRAHPPAPGLNGQPL
eukprot:gene22217-biopygen4208